MYPATHYGINRHAEVLPCILTKAGEQLSGDHDKSPHIFGFIKWFRKHQKSNWFGSSAIACHEEFEFDSIYSFIPIQQILSVCIYGSL